MSRFRLLLLDANVVIYLFKLGLWNEIIDLCDVHLAATVVDECDFYKDELGDFRRIDLNPYLEKGVITKFEVPLEKIIAFRAEFNEKYKCDLDDGETESLTFFLESKDEYTICSADHIVFQLLGSHFRSEQGISLEELLGKLGKTKKVDYQFTKDFREKCSRSGFADGIQGRSNAN